MPTYSPITPATPVAVVSAPAVDVPRPALPDVHNRVQRWLDVSVGLLLLALALPVIAVAWVLIRLTSAGPGFYSQCRVGRNGETFVILKLRTMYHECESDSGVRWATKNDARVTAVGRVLRKLHIDELPQLLNIVGGDMSLVGPRPERPEFVAPLSAAIPGYKDRLIVRPGLTGLAQIQLPPDSDIESVRRKLVLDRCYIGRRGLAMDLRLLAGTALYLVGFTYAGVRWALRLPDPLAPPALADPLADTVIDAIAPK